MNVTYVLNELHFLTDSQIDITILTPGSRLSEITRLLQSTFLDLDLKSPHVGAGTTLTIQISTSTISFKQNNSKVPRFIRNVVILITSPSFGHICLLCLFICDTRYLFLRIQKMMKYVVKLVNKRY